MSFLQMDSRSGVERRLLWVGSSRDVGLEYVVRGC